MKRIYPFKPAIITGLAVGIFAIASFTIADALNKQMAWGMNPTNIRGICGLLTLIILSLGIYYGMQSVKQLHNGALTYTQAISAGIFIAVTTGIITAITGFIYCEFINPDNAAYMLAESKKEMISRGETAEQIRVHLTELGNQLSTTAQVVQALIGQSVCGTVIAAIMALFIRTKQKS